MTLAEIKDKLSRIMKAFIRELIKAYFELANEAILKDKTSRKERGLVVERRSDKRSVYTIFGDISFKRTYYYDKKRNAYIYPLDKALGLDKYERLTEAVAIKLVETAGQVKKKDQEGENADKRHKFTLNLEEILGPVASELGCITVLGTGKVTPLYTTLKGICHSGFDF